MDTVKLEAIRLWQIIDYIDYLDLTVITWKRQLCTIPIVVWLFFHQIHESFPQ